MPRITLDPIASKKEIAPGDLAQLKNAGLILADKDLEEDLRRRYVLPPKQRLTDALQSKKDRQALEEQFGVTLTDTPDAGTTTVTVPAEAATQTTYERGE